VIAAIEVYCITAALPGIGYRELPASALILLLVLRIWPYSINAAGLDSRMDTHPSYWIGLTY